MEEDRAGKALECPEFNGLFCESLEDKNAIGNEDNETLAYEVHREVGGLLKDSIGVIHG